MDELPDKLEKLTPTVLSEVENTKILKIHSLFSNEPVSSGNTLAMLPEYCQGTSGRSRVFKTMWPFEGAKGASHVASIAKAINGHSSSAFAAEVKALHRVRYKHQVLLMTSVKSHHLRLGNWLT